MRSRGRLRACAFGLGYIGVAAAAVAATPALALWDGKLTPFVEQKVTWDDNVFRLSSNSPGDTYTTTSLGFSFDAPVSRQRFQADYTWSATRFNEFTDLDFNGHDARALWLLQVLFDGPAVMPSVSLVFRLLNALASGLIIGLVYFTDLARRFEPRTAPSGAATVASRI